MYHIVWKDRKKVIMFLDTNLPLWKIDGVLQFFLNFVRRLFTMTLSKMANSFLLAQTNKSFLYSVVWIIENIYQRIKISCKIANFVYGQRLSQSQSESYEICAILYIAFIVYTVLFFLGTKTTKLAIYDLSLLVNLLIGTGY